MEFTPPTQQPRQKEPIDGPGPRGFPDCYYKSRVLNSTARYVRFVKKLRLTEEEQAKGLANKLKDTKDQQINDFFIRCDRRSLINNVAHRVELCMRSYEDDLQAKRQKLIDLLQKEEEENIRNFVIQAQAGRETLWREKRERLDYFLAKRKKEHEEKYKDTPLSKCAHVLPCIYKLRAKEAQRIQLYQMREKESRQLSEKEYDKMWHEVAMKESEALAARMEQDAIERCRRDLECKEHSDMVLEQRRLQKERDREMLKKEQLYMQQQFESARVMEEQEEMARREKRMQTSQERARTIAQRKEMLDKQQAEEKLLEETWKSLTGQGLVEEQAKVDLMRRKKEELVHCNKILIKQRDAMRIQDNDGLLNAEAKRTQDIMDQKRCEYLLWSQKTNRDVRKAMIDQINERETSKGELQKKLQEQEEYQKQVLEQQNELLKYKNKEDMAAKRRYQRDLLSQIEYNKLLKERARQEELDEIKKGQQAAKEYEDEIKRMLCRPYFSEEVHPFMRKMSKGLKMKEKCPCAKPNYCKD